MTTNHWTTAPERGNAFWINFILWFARNLGRPVGRALLYPTAAYFWLFSRHQRRASAEYLAAVFGRRATIGETFRHYLCFARVLLDRALLALGHRGKFIARTIGLESAQQALRDGPGCVFVGAHFGNYEVLRAAVGELAQLDIKILMRPGTNPRFASIMGSLNPAWCDATIPLGTPSSMLLAKEHLRGGGILGALADRPSGNDPVLPLAFLGRPAPFPLGPYLLAHVLRVPVVAFFAAYVGSNVYEVRFTRLAPAVASTTGDAFARACATEFAGAFEAACRAAPYNWFNFYDFWTPPSA